ncbi:beta-1,6-N-acetylglucosaminyltransferase [Sphingorhabdus sp.]|uniref:beta-1,6-N-acetylglucosaminyltransferase n=1 Tax=Sphingorhabdus sp. TaxID=1902408 RepID=UPI00391C0FAE
MGAGAEEVIGFIIVSHRSATQLLRLVKALNHVYDHPPIACHHDMHQSPIDQSQFPPNVKFVERPVRTGWGKFSIVQGALSALKTLYEFSSPDWFVLLSAADFPIRPADEVLSDLQNSGADAFIDFRSIYDGNATRVSKAANVGETNPHLYHYDSAANRLMKKRHYTGAEIWLPRVRRDNGGLRLGRHTVHLPIGLPWSPFSRSLECFYGDQWFTANRRVATILLQPTPDHLRLQRHLASRFAPDECYYQSVLCNDPSLVLHRDNKRFAEWNGGGAHPQELTTDLWSKMFDSGAHFARKFGEEDGSLSDLLRIVEARGRQANPMQSARR